MEIFDKKRKGGHAERSGQKKKCANGEESTSSRIKGLGYPDSLPVLFWHVLGRSCVWGRSALGGGGGRRVGIGGRVRFVVFTNNPPSHGNLGWLR
jgi:hypothetical protein